MKSMNDLFLHGLQDLYTAEKKILQSLPKMTKNVSADKLKKAL